MKGGRISPQHLVLTTAIVCLGLALWETRRTMLPEECFELNFSQNMIVRLLSLRSPNGNFLCKASALRLPSEIKGIKIKKIGTGAFAKKGLRRIWLPEGLQEIATGAFIGNGIKKVRLHKEVLIASGAFDLGVMIMK